MSQLNVDTIEPEGASTTLTLGASGDTVDVPSGATLAIASGATIANSGTASGFGLFSSYAIIADQKTQNTAGGTYTNGAWRTHDLQTEIADPDGIVSISTNQFTLAAGTYFIKWTMVLGPVLLAQSRLYNITDTAVSQIGTVTGMYPAGYGTSGSSISGIARVTIAGSKAFEIQLRGSDTASTTGFGYAANFSTEQYCTVEIFKEA